MNFGTLVSEQGLQARHEKSAGLSDLRLAIDRTRLSVPDDMRYWLILLDIPRIQP